MIALAVLPGAAAVAVGLVSLRLHFQPPTVPVYAVANAGPEPVTLAPGGQFDLELHPQAPLKGAVAARGFLLQGETVRPWNPEFTVTTDENIRISGPVDVLFAGVPPGAWEVAVAVGRPETLPTAPMDVLRGREAQPDESLGWRLVRERVLLRP